ncbi:MAG: HD domain-containing protein [Verrucomicrobia bacterium]|jgi:putative hydrolase of HD superfamily|nr:MAG: HD domain-containing protein [Verrucomicrobiota bacterium]MDH4470588.1 HD domain-containing protein [Verrucomicrobiae bacterium]
MEITSLFGEKFYQQISFILEIDKLKTVLRKTMLLYENRFENSAEHSWQIALAAIILAEYANEKIDIAHVTKILLVHDLVEVYCGDTFHYHKEDDTTLSEREIKAAQKIFGLLPAEQAQDFFSLWIEFESQQTPEAQFANSIDRFMPILLHSFSETKIWNKFSITQKQIIDKNNHIEKGSTLLWDFTQSLIQKAVEKGDLS